MNDRKRAYRWLKAYYDEGDSYAPVVDALIHLLSQVRVAERKRKKKSSSSAVKKKGKTP